MSDTKDDSRSTDRRVGITIPAEKARQGEIILRRPWQRVVFVLGLAGGVILAIVLAALAR